MTRTKQQNFFLILTLGILNALTPFSIDMYLPSFPSIASDLNVTVAQVALSVSTYFIGFSLGQIIYGPFLDRFGRKPPLIVGLVIYVAASIGCMTAHSMSGLLWFRFLASLGGCATSIGATAMVRDFFPPEESTKIFSLLMMVLSASPLLAPTIGSFVVSVTSWRIIFLILTALGVINIFLVLFGLKGALGPDPSAELRLKPILRTFYSILSERDFLVYTLAGSFSFAGLFVYVAGAPSIFMETFHVSTGMFGAIFAFLVVGMVGGGQLNLLLIKLHSEARVFQVSLYGLVLSGTAFLCGTYFDWFGLYGTIFMLLLILTFTGISYPNAAALALKPFNKNLGSASAMLGFLQLGIGALTSAGVGLLEMKGALPTAVVVCVASFTALLILFLGRRPQDVLSLQQSS